MNEVKKRGRIGGRQKGSKNRLTIDLKTMIDGALSAVGGQKYLEKQARDNPVAFLSLVGKCLPKDITISKIHQISEMTDKEILERIERIRAVAGAAAAQSSTPDSTGLH